MTERDFNLTYQAEVNALREVEWESFSPNFFVVGTPAGFDDLPASFVTSMQVGDDQGNFVRDVVQQFPSVTVIEIGKMIERVTGILDRAALAVQYVFVFTLLAGVLVLVAAVLATRRERFHEAAILRTPGLPVLSPAGRCSDNLRWQSYAARYNVRLGKNHRNRKCATPTNMTNPVCESSTVR